VLHRYFEESPYSWFNNYERMLGGFDCSYYDGSARNMALHTDLFTPLATDPTWSDLSLGQCQLLARGGTELWHRLVRHLRPHVILISMAIDNLKMIHFPVVSVRRPIYKLRREHRLYYILHQRVRINEDGDEADVIFGPMLRRPFGKLSHVEKEEASEAIAARLARLVDPRQCP
jgi:hypothetical protein